MAPDMPRRSAAMEAFIDASAGGSSAIVSSFVLHPLEMAKTMIQTGKSKKGFRGTLREIYNRDGLLALWRGVSVQCCEECMENFVFFYLYSAITHAAQKRMTVSAGTNLFLGYIAGVGTTTLVMPVEVLSTRMQVSKGSSILQVFNDAWREDGIQGLFKGFWFSLVLCANPAIQNTCFDFMKRAIILKKAQGGSIQNIELRPVEAALLGSSCKALALLFCYPLVRLKVLLQAGSKDEDKLRTDSKGLLRDFLAKIGTFYKGLGTALTKNVVSAGFMYMMKEKIAALTIEFIVYLTTKSQGAIAAS